MKTDDPLGMAVRWGLGLSFGAVLGFHAGLGMVGVIRYAGDYVRSGIEQLVDAARDTTGLQKAPNANTD